MGIFDVACLAGRFTIGPVVTITSTLTSHLGCQFRQLFEFALRGTVFERKILTFFVAKLPKAFAQCLDASRVRRKRAADQYSDARDLRRLLRPNGRTERKEQSA